MSTNGITGITGIIAISPTDRVALPSTSPSAAQPTLDEGSQQPAVARFPWLSRLSRQLESAAHQPAAFPAAPALGDHLDQSA